MKIVKLFIIAVVIISLTYVNGSIVINMEPEEMHRFGEILVESYIRQQSASTVVSRVTSFALGALQLCGIMFTLVGANLITSKLEFSILPSSSRNTVTNTTVLPTINPSQLCENDYGCDVNMCWRTCSSEDSDSKDDVEREKK